MTVICVFGESTTWGAWDKEKGGWVNRLQLSLASKMNYELEIYNLGISGGTTVDLLKRFELETKARQPEIIIISTGGNDAAFNKKSNSNNVSVEDFEKNVKKIINIAKRFTKSIVLLGLRDIDEKLTTPVSWDKQIFYKNQDMKKYGTVIKKVAKDENIFYIEQYGLLNSQELDDGIHPNAKGHVKIAKRVEDFLIKNKILKLK